MPTPWLFAIIAEDLSDDFAFNKAMTYARAAQPALVAGRDRYQILDKGVLFPSDRHAMIAANGVFGGIQPQQNQASIAGLTSPVCWAYRIRPVQNGRRRLLFFGLTTERNNPIVIGPPSVIAQGDKDAIFISDM